MTFFYIYDKTELTIFEQLNLGFLNAIFSISTAAYTTCSVTKGKKKKIL